MATKFDVVQNKSSGRWQVREDSKVINDFERLEDAVAYGRAALLERERGSMVVYTPSGRPRVKLSLKNQAGHKTVQSV